MDRILALLRLAALHGRWLLTAGLAAGIGLPELAAGMKDALPWFVATLLFLAALRVGPKAAIGAIRDLGHTILIILIFQLLLPLAWAAAVLVTGTHTALTTSITLMLAASPISGSMALTILLGHEGAMALRLLILGTALIPLTIIPVFWMIPGFESAEGILFVSLRLLALIALATIAAFSLRLTVLRNPKINDLQVVDGIAAVVMAVIVIGLMAAIRPAMTERPLQLLLYLLAAFTANFSLQFASNLFLRNARWRRDRAAISISAGNRNIALFLVALPAALTDPLLLFIGCYQIPMYLTPLLLRRLYGRPHSD